MEIPVNTRSLNHLLIQNNESFLCWKTTSLKTLITNSKAKTKQTQLSNCYKQSKKEKEKREQLRESWFQQSCISYSCGRERGFDTHKVAWRRAGSCIQTWYFGTCASIYGTIITFCPSKLNPHHFSFSVASPGSNSESVYPDTQANSYVWVRLLGLGFWQRVMGNCTTLSFKVLTVNLSTSCPSGVTY